jgi:hypothetical protein
MGRRCPWRLRKHRAPDTLWFSMVAHEHFDDDVTSLPSRPFTRAEYERLTELGFFENERIELLNGRLVPMNPRGAPHANLIGS